MNVKIKLTRVKAIFQLLPQDYRKITARLKFKMIWLAYIFFFFLLAVPLFSRNQFYYLKKKTLIDSHNPLSRLRFIHYLIGENNLNSAQNELKNLADDYRNWDKPTKEIFWRENLKLAEASPRGTEELVKNWREFLENSSDYKIGWLYLSYYQFRLGQEEAAQISLRRAQKIDPSLSL